jgi:hypothetical protein
VANDKYDDRGRGDDRDDRDDRGRDRYDDRDDRRGGGGGDPVAEAKKKVKAPGIGLIVAAVISIGFAVFGLVTAFTTFDAQWDEEMEKAVAQQPAGNQERVREMMGTLKPIVKTAGPVINGLQILCAVLMILGATKMLNLSSAGWGKTAAILGIIPVHSCLPWVLGLIFGIIALVALAKPEVKRGFAMSGRKATGGTNNAADDDRWGDSGR